MIRSLQEVISIPILSHVEWTEHDRTQLQWKVLGAVTSYAADGQRPQAESATALFSTFEADPKAPCSGSRPNGNRSVRLKEASKLESTSRRSMCFWDDDLC